jgi:hypothetical protein
MYKTHGLSWSGTHHIWRQMLYRCDNENCPDYHNYGGRGITYDPRWTSFEAFLADMGHKPPGKTLDRLDNNGPYCKANCRWATQKEQAQNQRKSIRLTINGRTEHLSVWAEEKGLSYTMVYQRYRTHGADPAKLFRLR